MIMSGTTTGRALLDSVDTGTHGTGHGKVKSHFQKVPEIVDLDNQSGDLRLSAVLQLEQSALH
jgi:hypothetical protein